MIAYEQPTTFPPGSITVESVITSKSRMGQAATTKTRRFSCACLTVLAARGLHPGDTLARPVEDGRAASAVPFYVALAGSYAQVQAVAANLRSGRRAQLMSGPVVDGYISLPAQSGYRAQTVRGEDGTTVLTLYLPWAVQREPQERPESKLRIANLVPRAWLAVNVALLQARHGLDLEQAQQAAIAAFVVDRLDKATRWPILADLGFRRHLYRKLVDTGDCWLAKFTDFQFGHGRPTMCWPAGSADGPHGIFAHASVFVGDIRETGQLIERATREWSTLAKAC